MKRYFPLRPTSACTTKWRLAVFCAAVILLVGVTILLLVIHLRKYPINDDRVYDTQRDCGIREEVAVAVEPHVGEIVGGKRVSGTSWPWYAALQIRKNSLYTLCGASVIAPRFLLTAAHCLVDAQKKTVRPSQVRVWLQSFKPVVVKAVRLHPRFFLSKMGRQVKQLDHDIAILELHRDIEVSRLQRPICLPLPELKEQNTVKVQAGQTCMAGGRGQNSVAEQPEKTLHEPHLKQTHFSIASARKHRTCGWTLSMLNKPEKLLDSVMCGFGHDDSNICLGDSGGGLICSRNSSRWTIEGISSIVIGKNCRGFSIFTNVHYYMKWILQNIEK